MRATFFSAAGLIVLSALGHTAALSTGGPTISARSSMPSAARRHEARAPVPSSAKRSARDKREQRPLTSGGDISRQLCPFSMSVCPLSVPSSTPTTLSDWIEEGYECVEFASDLTSCGGCGIMDASHDCTAIPGSLGVSCIGGNCRVNSCKAGYTVAADSESCIRRP